MKIELTIKTSYMPNWGIWEGIRELVQNGKDAEVEQSAPLTVRHRKESNTLVIENEGTTLPYEALLLGYTSKVGRSELIGKFGEGLKLGILALVRAGSEVRIRSGSEVWVPSIQRSEKFNADVLVFTIEKGRKEQDRVAIEIGGVDVEAWAKVKDLFLFLSKASDKQVETSSGTLLLEPHHKGKLFVKGIFVANDPRFAYGYDFRDAEVDRDRKMIDHYDLQYRTQSIWQEAAGRRPDLLKAFGTLLDNQAADIEGIGEWQASNVPVDTRKALVTTFQDRHGKDALPVASLAESAEVEHLGKRGVITPKALRLILERELGTVAVNKAKLKEEVTKTYGWSELSPLCKENLLAAIALVNEVSPVTLEDVDVVDFRDPLLRGLYRDGRVQLAFKILPDEELPLRVLVHEVAHRAGGDGEKSHVSTIESIWSGITKNLRKARLPRVSEGFFTG